MPIKVPDNLPAIEILSNEKIFVMNESRAYSQDIRPLKIVILNLMPNKQETEVQLLRMLSNTPLQIDVTFLHTETHVSKHTSADYLETFYATFDAVKAHKYDGMIITGAPVELIPFEEVDYWEELKRIMDWTKTNVTSTLHICWAAQAGLYHHYGVPKHEYAKKRFGLFPHKKKDGIIKLLFGFDERFYAPYSIHTETRRDDIAKISKLDILAETEDGGVYIVASKDGRHIFVIGHGEYNADTLKNEYDRDVSKGLPIDIPKNYYPNDDPALPPLVNWRAHGNLLFTNWLNYYVYQETPYEH
jgi:homoserine O-succinyltransferase